MKQGKIEVCWQDQNFYSLPYESAGGYGQDEYIMYGHDNYKHIINNDVYVGPLSSMPEFSNEVINRLPDHEHYEVAFYRTPPANILPVHKDMYANFMKMHNIDDVNKITRYIVFLEDAKLGHMFNVDKVVLCDWKKGDWICWSGSTPHAAYNMGIEHRYTMQITAFDR
jgi:hypothetical protein